MNRTSGLPSPGFDSDRTSESSSPLEGLRGLWASGCFAPELIEESELLDPLIVLLAFLFLACTCWRGIDRRVEGAAAFASAFHALFGLALVNDVFTNRSPRFSFFLFSPSAKRQRFWLVVGRLIPRQPRCHPQPQER